MAIVHRSETRDWTEDFGHENGRYQNNCVECGHMFYGHKRRHMCKECSLTSTHGEGHTLGIEGHEERLSVRSAVMPRGDAEAIPEYFAKPDVTEALSQAHPVLLVRQMANEILRLRADHSATRQNFILPHMSRGWETKRSEHGATCHSIVIGGVLCRWWGEEVPPGVAALDEVFAKYVGDKA